MKDFKSIKNIIKSIKNNKKYIFALSNIIAAVVFSIASCFALLFPTDEILDCINEIGFRILVVVIIMMVSYLIIVGISVVRTLTQKKFKILAFRSKRSLYLEYGDLFNCGEKNEKKNIVFSGNRCFDTIVDEDLINSNSIHGAALKRIYNSAGERNHVTVNKEIQKNLNQHEYSFENVDKKDKRSGNLQRYEVGAVAEIDGLNNERYFMLGLTYLNNELKAKVEEEDYIKAIGKLLRYISNRSQGYPTYIPVIGAGSSGVGNVNDLTVFIVNAFKLFEDRINCDIHIVVNEKDEMVDIYRLKTE